VQLCGAVEELLSVHRLLSGPRRETKSLALKYEIVQEQHTPRQTTLLVRSDGAVNEPWWDVSEVRLEELVVAYMSKGSTHRAGASEPARPLAAEMSEVAR
jgi:ABC-2 type transport system ATP-binding protein